MNDIWDLERELREYTPNFAGIRVIAEDLSATLSAHGNVWFRLTTDYCESVIRVAIRHYMCRTHQTLLARMGRPVSAERETLFSEVFKIPRYVRDVCREFCRVMEHDAVLWLPTVDTTINEGSILSYHGDIAEDYPRFLLACERVGLEMVHIEIESLALSPFMMYSDVSQCIFSVRPPAMWRLEAFNRLRHARHIPPVEPVVGEQGAQALPTLFTARIVGRQVGPIPFFTFGIDRPLIKYGIIIGARFPTDEEHSKTPPRNDGRKK
jgi:hypothetical protein